MTAATLNALAEPHRLEIVELLREGPRPVGEIAERLQLAQPQVSKHLRVLDAAGWVGVRPMANRRIYHLRAAPLRELDAWLDRFRAMWDQRFDRLEAHLRDTDALQDPEEPHPGHTP